MLNFLLNQSSVFVIGEVLLALCLSMFAFAWLGAVRERYAIRVPVAMTRRRSKLSTANVQARAIQPAE
jgi:hypothetical protein